MAMLNNQMVIDLLNMLNWDNENRRHGHLLVCNKTENFDDETWLV